MEANRKLALPALALAAAAALAWPGTALGHGETATTDPEAGARLRKAPQSVSVRLTEPPAEGARFRVVDGCRRVVSREIRIDGETMTVGVARGEPGKWRARYRVVSSVDGHVTSDAFAFRVRGKKDCSGDEPKNADGEGSPDGAPEDGRGGEGGAAPPADEGGSFPLVPVAAGTLVLVGAAVAIRARSAR